MHFTKSNKMTMGDSQFNNMTDQDFLVHRARSVRSQNPYVSKAWMLTAKSLFPDNFSIQFEAYSTEREEDNARECAKCLQRLFQRFPDEEVLWVEINSIMEALKNCNRGADPGNKSDQFLLRMFGSLPESSQQGLIAAAADRAKDTMEHCRLMLILMKRFPHNVMSHGEKLVETLLSVEKHELGANAEPLNHYRRILVSEVLPLVMEDRQLAIQPKTVYKLLFKSKEFVVAYVNNKATAGFEVKDPWKLLYKLLEGFGSCLNWSVCTNLGTISPEEFVGSLAALQRQALQSSKDSPLFHQLFHCATIACLHAIFSYNSYLEIRDKERILIEAFVTHERLDKDGKKMGNKRRKTLDEVNSNAPIVTHGSSSTTEDNLISVFQRACSTWQLVTAAPSIEQKFMNLMAQLSNTCGPLGLLNKFCADYKLQAGQYREAMQFVREMFHDKREGGDNTGVYLKLATVHYCMGDHRSAAQNIVECVSQLESLPPSGRCAEKPSELTQPTSRPRHLRFLPYQSGPVLAYCCGLLTKILQERAVQPNASAAVHGDMAIGHLMVVLQHNWPDQQEIFYLLLRRIRMKEAFAYPLFSQYIINIDILEEVSYLASDKGGGVALDVVPGAGLGPRGRVGTRGTNRGDREDFKGGMKRLAMRSHEPVDKIIVEFLIKNRDIILQCLA